MPQTLNVNVAVTPKGQTPADGVQFAYSAGANTPPNIVSPTGDINCRALTNPGNGGVNLVFALTTPTITFPGANGGPFNMSFFGGPNPPNDARNAMLIGQPPTKYSGSEFTGFSFGSGNLTLTVTDVDNDGGDYYYALVVWADTAGRSGTTYQDDPSILNRQN